MKRLSLLLVAACNGASAAPDLASGATCLDYATALLGECFDAVRASEKSELQCDSGLLEAGYNACNMVLEAGQSVCVPYRSTGSGTRAYADNTATHDCSATVSPPAPPNWRGTPAPTQGQDFGGAEREP